MDIRLTPMEARVLGCLIEKERTTPEYYPLTLNALTNACNQKSNRDPVMTVEESSVVRTIDSLHDKGLVYQRTASASRVPRYAHRLTGAVELSPQELAVVCLLLLRGAQTPGELRSRTERLCSFEDLRQLDAVLQRLAEREDGPFVVKLPRETGRRERRYAHLFCGDVKVEEAADGPAPEPARLEVQAENERIGALEQSVAALRTELDELKAQFGAFKRELEGDAGAGGAERA